MYLVGLSPVRLFIARYLLDYSNAEEYSTVKNMNAFFKKFLASEPVFGSSFRFLLQKNQPISKTIISHALQINAKIIISSTKSSGQVFGSLENRYEVGGTSNDLLWSVF